MRAAMSVPSIHPSATGGVAGTAGAADSDATSAGAAGSAVFPQAASAPSAAPPRSVPRLVILLIDDSSLLFVLSARKV